LEETVSAAQTEQDPSLLAIFMHKPSCAKGLEWLETYCQSTLILKVTLDIPLPFFVQNNTSLVQEEDDIFDTLCIVLVFPFYSCATINGEDVSRGSDIFKFEAGG
jgi:hypothetical protein